MRPNASNRGLGRIGPDGFYGSGLGEDHPEDLPPSDAPRLRDELNAIDHAIRRMKAKPRYEEASLAELEVRRRGIASQLAALEQQAADHD